MLKQFFTILLALFLSGYALAQKTVTGKVTDRQGEALIGANVSVVGDQLIGTVTDLEGMFSLEVPSATEKLTISYTGYKTLEVAIGANNYVEASMDAGELLDEVVVIGYGVQRKSDITSSISKVDGSSIAGIMTPNFATQLAGRAPGVQITQQTGIVGEGPRIRIRGIASVNSGTFPLVVVDGIPIYTGDLGGYASASGLGDINPADIESYEILKDGAATAIYGSRAANGVILITTKKGKKGVQGQI